MGLRDFNSVLSDRSYLKLDCRMLAFIKCQVKSTEILKKNI
jgi:hypothetical protein